MDELHIGHPAWTRMLAESPFFWWSGMRKEINKKSSQCNASMSFGKTLKYQLLSMEKIQLPVLTETGQEKKNWFLR